MPPPEPESIAVALVVESSLHVAHQWPAVAEYTFHLIRRFVEANTKVRIAYITYGTADTVPSPIIQKAFFTDFTVVLKDIREAMPTFGFHCPNSNGKRGMAALDALVSSLELFDCLTQPQKSKAHVVHIAASPPDSSINPSCNDSPALDSITWDLLPQEFKKRDIHYNAIILRPIERLSTLYATLASSRTNPWFPRRSTHAVLLDGFTPPKGNILKRQTPPSAEQPPDKKPRSVAPPAESPKVQPKLPPSSPVPPTVPPPVSQPAQPTPQQQPARPNTIKTPAQYALMVNMLEGQMRQIQSNMVQAEAAGNQQQVEVQKEELLKRQKAVMSFKLHYQKMQQNAAAASTSSSSSNPPPPSEQSLLQPQQPQPQPQPQQLPPAGFTQPIRPPVQSFVMPPQQPPPSMAPNLAAGAQPHLKQMQKMIEQQQRLKASTSVAVSQSMSALPSMSMQSQGQGQNPNPPQPQPQVQPQAVHLPNNANTGGVVKGVAVWSGTFMWTGVGTTGGKKDMSAFVTASSSNPAACHAETWASTFNLMPSREPAVSMIEMQPWMKRHNPAICTFLPKQGVPDFKTNEANFRSLHQLLTAKMMYATAAWTTPSGGQTNNVLIFTTPNGLLGAFFPLTGIPDFPKPVQVPGVSPDQMAMIHAMPLDKRNQVITSIMRQRQQQVIQQHQLQQQQQQNSQQNQGMMQNTASLPFNPQLQPPGGGGMNMMNNGNGGPSGQQPSAMSMIQNVPGGFFTGRPDVIGASASLPGNLKLEMLQSFMQRSQDVNMNHHQGPGPG